MIISDEISNMFRNEVREDFFWRKAVRYDYTDVICKILKGLKFNYESNGAYSRRVLVCNIDDNIDMIKEFCIDESKAVDFFAMCYVGISLLCRKFELPDSFINKHNVKPWHVSLIRRTYFYISLNCQSWSYTNSDCEISIGDKRPYGNSDILGDISEEYFRHNKPSDECESFFWEIMDETNDIIQKMLKEVDYSNYAYTNVGDNTGFGYYTENWEICKSVIRNKKIDKLIRHE